MRKPTVDGVTRGNPRPIAQPPPALPLVQLPRAGRVGSHGMTVDEVVRQLVSAYVDEAGPNRAKPLLRWATGRWCASLRCIAAVLLEQGMSPLGYVRFVCARLRAYRGRVPFPSEVFPEPGLDESWMSQVVFYRREAAGYLELPHYVATPARRRAHVELLRACLSSATS